MKQLMLVNLKNPNIKWEYENGTTFEYECYVKSANEKTCILKLEDTDGCEDFEGRLLINDEGRLILIVPEGDGYIYNVILNKENDHKYIGTGSREFELNYKESYKVTLTFE